MPRIRSVHPEICEDDVLAKVSAYAERTFVRLWTHLDDEGRGVDGAKLWKARLYPLHDSMTVERVEKDFVELEAKGLLQRYTVDGKGYICVKQGPWKRWQRPQRPTESRIPPPPPASPPRALREPSASPHPVVEGRGGEKEGESEGDAPREAGPPDGAAHNGQHRNCRSCGTNRRVTTATPTPPDPTLRPPIPDAAEVIALHAVPRDQVAPMPDELRARLRKNQTA